MAAKGRVNTCSQSSISMVTQPLPPGTDEFPRVFGAPDYECVSHKTVHHIDTGEARPVHAKARPLSAAKLAAAKQEFESLLSMGIIRRSSSPWASPLHVVPKPNGTWRPCGDYRELNSVTIPDRYPTPNINQFASVLAAKTTFSKLDLVKATIRFRWLKATFQKRPL
jgi:hypothetical protein